MTTITIEKVGKPLSQTHFQTIQDLYLFLVDQDIMVEMGEIELSSVAPESQAMYRRSQALDRSQFVSLSYE